MVQVEIIQKYHNDSFDEFECKINKSIQMDIDEEVKEIDFKLNFVTVKENLICIITKTYK